MKNASVQRSTFGKHGLEFLCDAAGMVHLTIEAARGAGLTIGEARLHARHNRQALAKIRAKCSPRYALEQAAGRAYTARNRGAYRQAKAQEAEALATLDKRAMRPHEKLGPPAVRVDFGWEAFARVVESKRGETVEAFSRRVAEVRTEVARRSLGVLGMHVDRLACVVESAETTAAEAAEAYAQAQKLAEWARKAAEVAPVAERVERVESSIARAAAAMGAR